MHTHTQWETDNHCQSSEKKKRDQKQSGVASNPHEANQVNELAIADQAQQIDFKYIITNGNNIAIREWRKISFISFRTLRPVHSSA